LGKTYHNGERKEMRKFHKQSKHLKKMTVQLERKQDLNNRRANMEPVYARG
jgi:hypothetical protein